MKGCYVKEYKDFQRIVKFKNIKYDLEKTKKYKVENMTDPVGILPICFQPIPVKQKNVWINYVNYSHYNSR